MESCSHANSGIIFYVNEDLTKSKNTWNWLEMQVLDNNGHPDAKIEKTQSWWFYDLIKSTSEPVKPVENGTLLILYVIRKTNMLLNGKKSGWNNTLGQF
jgi:hypothetical protein